MPLEGDDACPCGPLARSEARVAVERLFERTADIRISDKAHGPAVERRYGHAPTYMLRGLTQFHLELHPGRSSHLNRQLCRLPRRVITLRIDPDVEI